MDIPICSVCKSSIYQDQEPIIGSIIMCDHCSEIYLVIHTGPLELQMIGSTGELEDPAPGGKAPERR